MTKYINDLMNSFKQDFNVKDNGKQNHDEKIAEKSYEIANNDNSNHSVTLKYHT